MHRLKILAMATLIVVATAGSAAAQRFPGRALPGENRSQVSSRPGVHVATGAWSNPFALIDYPGGIPNQVPFAINDKGNVVGYAILPDGSAMGYLLRGKTFIDLVYPGAALTGAEGINRSGTVVGAYCLDIGCTTGSHGYVLKARIYATIDYPGGMDSGANGVNASGDIVGQYTSPDFVTHGFLLHNGAYTGLDAPGATQTIPFAINKTGMIVGLFVTPDNVGHGFILQSGVYTQIDYPGATGSELTSMNDSGDAVGIFDDASGTHGFLLSGGTFTPLDAPLPGTTDTAAWGINNNHQIVGGYGDFVLDYFVGFLTTY